MPVNSKYKSFYLKESASKGFSNTYNFGYLVLILLSTISCSPDYLTEEGLKKYILDENNGLTKKEIIKDYQIKVAYRPTDLLILQELGGSAPVNHQELERLKQKYKDYYYFTLSLSKDNKEALYKSGEGYGQFSELVQTLSFRMGNYVNITTSNHDTIFVADYVYPRTFGLSDATNLMFVFPKDKISRKEWLQFNLKGV